jgi:TatD DNase family protein
MLIDTHCHLDFESLHSDLDGVLKRAKVAEIHKFITIGCSINSWDSTLALCEKYSQIYGALGLHPHDAKLWNNDIRLNLIQKINSSGKIKALGEIGLDYYYLDKTEDINTQKLLQQEVFIDQLDMSKKLNIPVIVHTRDAWDDTFRILKGYVGQKIVIHCFSGDKEIAKELVAMGFYISFTGIVTFSKDIDYIDVLKSIPTERIMIETDSPYLAPIPKRGRQNEPSFLKFLFDFIEENLDIDAEDLEKILYRNSTDFFKLN